MAKDVLARANSMGHDLKTTEEFLAALRDDLKATDPDAELLTGDDAAIDAEIVYSDGRRIELMILEGGPDDTPAVFPFDFGGDN